MKTWGDIKLDPVEKKVCCKTCGVTFFNEKLVDSILDSQIGIKSKDSNIVPDCPICRITRGIEYSESLDNKGQFFINSKQTTMVNRTKSLNNLEIVINHENHSFNIPLKNLEAWLKRPSCRFCGLVYTPKELRKELTYINKQKSYKIDDKKQPIKSNEVKQPIKTAKEKETEVRENTAAVDRQSRKIQPVAASKAPSIMQNPYRSEIGKIFNRTFKIVNISGKSNIICSCLHCGSKQVFDADKINKKRMDLYVCNTCKALYGTEYDRDKLLDKYKGYSVNGMIVLEINIDEKTNAALCTLGCINSYDYITYEYKHRITNIPLADVLNNSDNVYCEICGNKDLFDKTDKGANLYNGIVNCSFFYDNGVTRSYTKKSANIKAKDFFKLKGSICDVCANRKTCQLRQNNEYEYNIETIKSKFNVKNQKKYVIDNLSPICPNIFTSRNKEDREALVVEHDTLLKIREAYIGRNGLKYYFCICTLHKKRFILSEEEIANFKHNECVKEVNPYSGIIDIKSDYLMKHQIEGV